MIRDRLRRDLPSKREPLPPVGCTNPADPAPAAFGLTGNKDIEARIERRPHRQGRAHRGIGVRMWHVACGGLDA
jgi:hypothetical protein